MADRERSQRLFITASSHQYTHEYNAGSASRRWRCRFARRARRPEPATPNPNAEPETILLWPDGAPGALGTEDADRPTLTIYRASRGTARRLSWRPGGGYGGAGHGPRRAAGGRVLQRHGRRGVRPQVPPRSRVPPSGRARRRAARPAARPHARAGVRRQRRSHRADGLLGRRTPGGDGRHALRRRQRLGRRPDRSRQQPARLPHPRLSGDHLRSRRDPCRLGAQPARREPGSEVDRADVERAARHRADAADVPLPHQRRHRRRPREQRSLLSGAAQGEGARRDAHLRERPARRGAGAGRSRAQRVACC